MTTDREVFPSAARLDFLAAVEGLPITTEQRRYVVWLANLGDQPTLNALADVIRLARAEVSR